LLIGFIGAFGQKRIKNFLAFSSMTQVGYSLVGMSYCVNIMYTAVFFSLFTYLFSNAIIFGILLSTTIDSKLLKNTRKIPKNHFFSLSDLQLLRQYGFLPAIAFSIAILSLAGFPPTLGFFAKYYFFQTLIVLNDFYFCLVLLFLNCISLYYYINILKNI
jgi:NADH-quinone oxidoreductase subunit N